MILMPVKEGSILLLVLVAGASIRSAEARYPRNSREWPSDADENSLMMKLKREANSRESVSSLDVAGEGDVSDSDVDDYDVDNESVTRKKLEKVGVKKNSKRGMETDKPKSNNGSTTLFNLAELLRQHRDHVVQRQQEISNGNHVCFSAMELILTASGAVALTTASVMLILSCCFCCYFRKRKADYRAASLSNASSEEELNYDTVFKPPAKRWGKDNNSVAATTQYVKVENRIPFSEVYEGKE